MIFQETMTQELSPIDYVAAQTVTNTTISTNGIDMSKFMRAQYYIMADGLGAAGVIAVQAQSAVLANFATVHNLANCVMTNMNTNNTVQTLEIRGDQITNQFPGDRYFRLNIIGSGNALTVGALGLGSCSPQGPASQYNNTSVVTQQVVCNT